MKEKVCLIVYAAWHTVLCMPYCSKFIGNESNPDLENYGDCRTIVFPISYIINDCIAEVWGFRKHALSFGVVLL